MTKVTIVTGGRADWGLLSPVCKALQQDTFFALRIVATGQHLMDNAGNSLQTIQDEGFDIAATVNMGLTKDDSDKAVTKALGRAIEGFADEFSDNRPDLLLILGDRYEIFGVVQAALIAKIPVAHLCGGDITEGAMDDSIRHAITKIAHFHFATNEDAKNRIIQMGENPACVYNVGNPGLDHIHNIPRMSHDEFFSSIGFSPASKNIMVTFHPVTLESNSLEQCQTLLTALSDLDEDIGIVITGSNADPEGQKINDLLRHFVHKRQNTCFHESLGTLRYFNALRHMDAIVGNSSSGLYEAPSFGLPTVNIGDRQKGRLKAPTVIDCPPEKLAIKQTIQQALNTPRMEGNNPYGDGHTAEKILNILKKADLSEATVRKVFFDREENTR